MSKSQVIQIPLGNEEIIESVWDYKNQRDEFKKQVVESL